MICVTIPIEMFTQCVGSSPKCHEMVGGGGGGGGGWSMSLTQLRASNCQDPWDGNNFEM